MKYEFPSIAAAIIETVSEFPDGAPSGPMYMATQQFGVPLEVYTKLMDTLVATGHLRQVGHCYFIAERKE